MAGSSGSARSFAFPAFLAVIVGLQLVLTLSGTDYYLTQLTMAAYYGLVVIGLSLLLGCAGQISIGHAAFFAMGGYTTAVLTARHVSPWIALAAALLLTGVVALLIGIPVLKLKGHYLAMATLGFGTIIYRILLGGDLFGAADGLTNVPPFHLGPLMVTRKPAFRIENYYVAWGLLALGLFLLLNLVRSRTGRALRAIHGNEEAAASAGINVSRAKTAVFVLSALYAAVGGFFLTHYNAGIGPSEASVMKSVRYLAIVSAGGMGSLWGTLGLSTLLNFLSLRGVFGSYDDAVFGCILILIMLFAPNGLLSPEVRRGFVRLFRRIPAEAGER